MEESSNILKQITPPDTIKLLRNVFNNRYHDKYYNNSHHSSAPNFNQIEEFCKILYIDWRNFLISNKNTFVDAEQQEIIMQLETNPFFFPENIEKKEGTPFYNFIFKGYDKIFKGSNLRYAKLQQGKDMSVINEEDNFDVESFMHVYGWKINGTEAPNVQARLYLNLMTKNIPGLVKAFYEKCKTNKLPFYFKFDCKDTRNDPFLIYSSYQDLEKYISIIEQIKKEQPELFEGTNIINYNLGTLYGYIGYSDEPNHENESANSIREKIITETRIEVLNKFKEKLGHSNSNLSNITNNPPLTYEELKMKIIKEYLEEEYYSKNKVFFTNIDNLKKQLEGMLSSQIDSSILSGEAITLNYIPNNWPPLNIDKLDWLKKFKDIITLEKNISNDTVLRAYLTRYISFQSPTCFNEQEKNLNQIILNYLKQGLNEVITETKNQDERDTAQIILSMLNIPASTQMDETGKALVILGSAFFKENYSLQIHLKNNINFDFSQYSYDIIKDFLGEDVINEIFKQKCKHYGISSENFAFNENTWQLINSSESKQIDISEK